MTNFNVTSKTTGSLKSDGFELENIEQCDFRELRLQSYLSIRTHPFKD